MRINLNTQENCQLVLMPDKQPHVILPEKVFYEDEPIEVFCSLVDSQKLLELCMVAEILSRNHFPFVLHIPYLMGARWDRIMKNDYGLDSNYESFDIKVIANIINFLKPNRVYLYDIHSDVSPALIENSNVITNRTLVQAYSKEKAVLIIPDAGAAKKAQFYMRWNKNIIDTIQCVKHRDSQGKIQLHVLDEYVCKDRNCVIIDDLCDGGATFNAIADQIKPKHLTLIVTHGIFSKGFEELEKRFQTIIIGNTYKDSYDSSIINVIKLF